MAPEDDTSAAGHMGEQTPWQLAMGATSIPAPSRIRPRRPIRLWNPASSLLQKKEVHRFHQ